MKGRVDVFLKWRVIFVEIICQLFLLGTAILCKYESFPFRKYVSGRHILKKIEKKKTNNFTYIISVSISSLPHVIDKIDKILYRCQPSII